LRYYEGGDQIIHGLRTVIVAPDGKFYKVYRGNEWKPAEAVSDLNKALQWVEIKGGRPLTTASSPDNTTFKFPMPFRKSTGLVSSSGRTSSLPNVVIVRTSSELDADRYSPTGVRIQLVSFAPGSALTLPIRGETSLLLSPDRACTNKLGCMRQNWILFARKIFCSQQQ